MSMSLHSLWLWGAAELAAAGVGDSRWQAELLLRGIVDVTRAKFMTYPELQVIQIDTERFRDAIWKRSLGTPVQYILGKQEFYGREFVVTPDVLIPRPETEVLVEEVLKVLSAIRFPLLGVPSSQLPVPSSQFPYGLRILDLCTGSGCIGLTLAAELREVWVVATDISLQALGVAEQNAHKLGVDNRVEFRQGDLFSALQGDKFDIIVSNPPYIESAIIPTLGIDVQNEPIGALDGGADGLEFYRRIADGLGQHLAPGGLAAVEIGHGQGTAVMQLFAQAGLINVTLTLDLAGKERVVTGRIRER
ncbi:MAG: peptide chain release factor N(5)-glutamine methyltransferase [Bacillota bacterium]|nr:peptide chain release factor N(5)-glutamine methyltransferase [Bacillota bacterium]